MKILVLQYQQERVLLDSLWSTAHSAQRIYASKMRLFWNLNMLLRTEPAEGGVCCASLVARKTKKPTLH